VLPGAVRGADEVLDELEQMIGLAPVKEEVNKLLVGIEVERKRREQGLPMQTVSRHMVFTGPPGVRQNSNRRACATVLVVIDAALSKGNKCGFLSVISQTA
jgi:hypothetical protein